MIGSRGCSWAFVGCCGCGCGMGWDGMEALMEEGRDGRPGRSISVELQLSGRLGTGLRRGDWEARIVLWRLRSEPRGL